MSNDKPWDVYLSGPMSGLPNHNVEEFNRAAAALRAVGWTVFNPAESFEGRLDLPRKDYMAVDIEALLAVAKNSGCVAVLPGWEKSRGAQTEVRIAHELAMPVWKLEPDNDYRVRERIVDNITAQDAPSSTNTGEVRVTDPKTGGQKGTKPERYDLIPVEPLRDLARVYGKGAEKYEDNNWKKGYDWKLSYAALQRHLNAFWGGEDLDPETHLPHLSHAAWHCFTLHWFMHNYTDGDSR